MHDANRMLKSTTKAIVKPGVVMQIKPSSWPEITTVGCSSLAFNGAAIGNVKSPDDTTLMIRFKPISFSGSSPAALCRRMRRSLRATPFRNASNGNGGGGGAPYCDSGPTDKWCTSKPTLPSEHWSGQLNRQICMVHWKWTSIESGNLNAWKCAYDRTDALAPKFFIFVNRDISFGRVTQPRWSTNWIGARFPSCATQFRTNISNLLSSSLIAKTIVIVCPIFTKPETSLAHGPLPTCTKKKTKANICKTTERKEKRYNYSNQNNF